VAVLIAVVLIAVALARTRSLNLLDRLTYGLNSESVRMAVADALRVVLWSNTIRPPGTPV
jgi:hypothetical protein